MDSLVSALRATHHPDNPHVRGTDCGHGYVMLGVEPKEQPDSLTGTSDLQPLHIKLHSLTPHAIVPLLPIWWIKHYSPATTPGLRVLDPHLRQKWQQ
jgi:hypothetical protein